MSLDKQLEAVWDVIQDRGLLKGVGDDLWDEIKADIGSKLTRPIPTTRTAAVEVAQTIVTNAKNRHASAASQPGSMLIPTLDDFLVDEISKALLPHLHITKEAEAIALEVFDTMAWDGNPNPTVKIVTIIQDYANRIRFKALSECFELYVPDGNPLIWRDKILNLMEKK